MPSKKNIICASCQGLFVCAFTHEDSGNRKKTKVKMCIKPNLEIRILRKEERTLYKQIIIILKEIIILNLLSYY
jgi:hypothetical protein